jgi:hypothetical protein
MTARIFNVLIGTWLFLSAFAWPHQSAQGFSALVCGVLTVLFALATIYLPNVCSLTAATAVLLFMTSIASATRLDRTLWHNAVIAIAIFVAALLDPAAPGLPRERELYGRI